MTDVLMFSTVMLVISILIVGTMIDFSLLKIMQQLRRMNDREERARYDV